MPSAWGLGILTHAGAGLDEDYGDTVDRLQFALPPVATPIGPLNFVPILDFDDEGALYADQRFGAGVGQPFDADSADDGRTFALKAARVDTDDELRRKLEAGRSSFNFGAYYNYRTQRNAFGQWTLNGFDVDPRTLAGIPESALLGQRKTYGHVLDLWARFATSRLRVEAEAVGVYGHVGQAFAIEDTNTDAGADPVFEVKPLGRVLLRQWGGSLVTEYKVIPNKLTMGVDLGIASGDDAPGFGNVPGRYAYDAVEDTFVLPPLGSIEGPQFGRNGDRSIRNFRFNPAYRVDLVLWRNILGQVTDAWYLRPKLRWDLLPGVVFDAAVIYSQALNAESTPSGREALLDPDTGTVLVPAFVGDKPLGVEADARLTYSGGEGFAAWAEWGVFQPLDGLGTSLSRGHVLNVGMAISF
jgi:uncharacterized protein (TIGR04551 family)